MSAKSPNNKQQAFNDFVRAFENLRKGLQEANQSMKDLRESLENWKFTKYERQTLK